MKTRITLLLSLILFTGFLFAQNKAVNETEISRIKEISTYKTIDSFSKAKDLNKTARKGDLVVLQDDTRKLYYGIIDTVRSPESIGIILYNEKNERELVEATYADLHYLNISQTPVKNSFTPETEARMKEQLGKMEEKLKLQDQKLEQLSNTVGSAGKAYETSDILLFSAYAGFGVGTALNALGSLAESSTMQGIGAIMVAGSFGASIGTVVMRFSGHNRLKRAGQLLRR